MGRTLGRRGAVFVVYVLLLCAAGVMFKVVPGGFIPTQDKLYLIGGVKMPEGSSLARTDAVIRKIERNRYEYRRRGLCSGFSGA